MTEVVIVFCCKCDNSLLFHPGGQACGDLPPRKRLRDKPFGPDDKVQKKCLDCMNFPGINWNCDECEVVPKEGTRLRDKPFGPDNKVQKCLDWMNFSGIDWSCFDCKVVPKRRKMKKIKN